MSSKNNKNKENNQGSFASNNINALAVAACLIVGSTGGFFAGRSTVQVGTTETPNTSTVEEATENPYSYDFMEDFISLSDAETTAALDAISTEMNALRSKSIVLQVQTSDNGDYDGYMYNTKGEVLVQSSSASYTSVFTKDGNSIRVDSQSGNISINSSIDILSICDNAIKNMRNRTQGYKMYSVGSLDGRLSVDQTTGESAVVYEFIVDITGKEACKTIFESAGSDYASRFIDLIVEQLGDSWEPHFEVGFVFTTENDLGMYCNIVYRGTEQNNWVCGGYYEADDWELPEEWYKAEFTDDNYEELVKMLNDFVNKLWEELEGEEATDSNEGTTNTSTEGEGTTTEGTTGSETTEGTTEGTTE